MLLEFGIQTKNDVAVNSLLLVNSQRCKTHVPALRVWSTDEPHPQEEVSLNLTDSEHDTLLSLL